MNVLHTKIIILEGVDKTGKSTLAGELSKQTGYPVVHLGVPEHKDHYKYLLGLMKKYKEGVIFDRFHWGDYVYAGVTLEDRLLSKEQFSKIEGKLRNSGTILIYCDSPINEIMERFEKDNEDLIDKKSIPKLKSRYGNMLQNTVLKVHRHDFKRNPFKISNLYKDMSIKNRIKEIRIKKDISQAWLADQVGLKVLSLRLHETHRRAVQEKYFERYSKALNEPVSKIFKIA